MKDSGRTLIDSTEQYYLSSILRTLPELELLLPDSWITSLKPTSRDQSRKERSNRGFKV